MDFFKQIEKERKRIERQKNKEMRDFVTKQINVVMNLKYLLEECYAKNLNPVFNKKNGYKIELNHMINCIAEILEIQSSITANGEVSEIQKNTQNNKYELNLILAVDEKREFLLWFDEFENIFNELDEIERKLIYYNLIEKESNTWLALNTNYSERTISTLKVQAINKFYRSLKLGSLTNKDSLKIKYNIF